MQLREMKRYRRGDGHSYALGTFCVLELLHRRPELALRVVLDPGAVDTEGGRLVRRAADRANVPLDVDARVPAALSRKGNVHALAAFEVFDDPPDAGSDHVVLVRPADFGNLGTIIRTMAALGLADLVLVSPAADLFDPQVVRASMGAVFGLRSAIVGDLTHYATRWPHQLCLFAHQTLFGTAAPSRLDAVGFTRPAALVFGPESSGLLPADLPPTGVLASRGVGVAIPQDPAVDSYNLAVSVALGLWELRRQSGALPRPR
jgi:TrmH family RNA methyltransferase